MTAARLHTPLFLAAAALSCAAWLLFGGGPLAAPAVLALGGLVLVLGLPHGALDLWVAAGQGRWGRQGRFTARGFVRFHAEYLALAAGVAAAFAVVPTLALTGFLLLSLWHFADDWRGLPLPVRLGCASVIVLVPSLFHTEDVVGIFAAVTGLGIDPPAALPHVFWLVSSWIVTGSVVSAFLIDRRAGAEAAMLVGTAAVLPPLVFFAVYFVLLHGPRHLVRHGGRVDGRRGRLVVALYTLAALGVVVAVGLLLSRGAEISVTDGAMRAVFAGLAALTVPHAILMEAEKRRQDRTMTNEAGHSVTRQDVPNVTS